WPRDWSSDVCSSDLPLKNAATGTSRIVDWLDESVRAHLVSDVPVAAFLSGGLDSSAVVASWSLASDAPPHAFTARYFGSGATSRSEERRVGKGCGSR